MSNSDPIAGGVTAPAGFRAAGVACGIKTDGLDVAVIDAGAPASAAAVFTTNLMAAAPVLVSRSQLEASGGMARAIIINSGCANACTGKAGLTVARSMADAGAERLGCDPTQILVASTGVIGVSLDAHKVSNGIAAASAALSRDGHVDAARAILTTDLGPKEAAVGTRLGTREFRVGGMAKGAGMIDPNMATMLAVLTTDARVDATRLQRALTDAVADTFNAITVDGEGSTNDSVFALASGASDVEIDEQSFPVFVDTLKTVARQLAVAIVRGGEGASKLVAIRAHGARTPDEARRAAKTLANSLLVKTALHGGDPNWGRLIAAAGRAGVAFDSTRAVVRIGDTILFKHGHPFDEASPVAASYLRGTDIEIHVDFGVGTYEATVWTCDLSAEYVRINSEYRT
ncbi:MAG: bifunctional ornithine acetyltransferase/N-acetylglutamate synthase [Acidobacteria bacterium]|nr:bifunctional ornithine acetyltransferase/N-acetylglutamate synthase [Acidobacteriota bacterium]